jgi:N-acetylglucosamine kinase-like BadF-type ATPase
LYKRAVGVHLHLDLAFGQLGGLLGEKLGGLALGRVAGHHMAELDDGLKQRTPLQGINFIVLGSRS